MNLAITSIGGEIPQSAGPNFEYHQPVAGVEVVGGSLTLDLLRACNYEYDIDNLVDDPELLFKVSEHCQSMWANPDISTWKPAYGQLLVILQTMEARHLPPQYDEQVKDHISYFMHHTGRGDRPTYNYITPTVMNRILGDKAVIDESGKRLAREYLLRMHKGHQGSFQEQINWQPVGVAEQDLLKTWIQKLKKPAQHL